MAFGINLRWRKRTDSQPELTRADQPLTIKHINRRVIGCILDFGPIRGRRREGRAPRGKSIPPRHSSLTPRTASYFGGSCVPTITVSTVVPSGFGLYLTKTSRLPLVYAIESCSLPAKRDVGCQPLAAMTS